MPSEKKGDTAGTAPSGKPVMNLEKLGLQTKWSGHYNPNEFNTPLNAFSYTTGTVFMNRGIWITLGLLCAIAFSIAILCLLFFENAHKMDNSKMDSVVKYLKVFLAFMLGLFMNNSLARWWVTMNAVTDYFNNIEKFVFCMNAFGVNPKRRKEMINNVLVSCHCLCTEVNSCWLTDDMEIRKCWSELFDELQRDGLITEAQVASLCQVRPAERATCSWSWVCPIMATLFEKEGLVGPAMNRLVLQCQVAVDMVSQLKVQISIQLPFMYAHMMACLVHLNNLLVSVTCGFLLGSTLSKMHHDFTDGDTWKLVEHSQGLLMTLVTLFVEPALYQAFLQIATNFCYPFGTEWYHIPLKALIRDMQVNLDQMNSLTDKKMGRDMKGYTPREMTRGPGAADEDDDE